MGLVEAVRCHFLKQAGIFSALQELTSKVSAWCIVVPTVYTFLHDLSYFRMTCRRCPFQHVGS